MVLVDIAIDNVLCNQCLYKYNMKSGTYTHIYTHTTTHTLIICNCQWHWACSTSREWELGGLGQLTVRTY